MNEEDITYGLPGIDPEKIYNTDTLANAAGLKASTIRSAVKDGRLPAYKIFGRLWVKGKDFILAIQKGEALNSPDW